ncbi:hypothetical protein KAR91_78995 [Candidatus Pacearchaeota archaeon]|nr:hypothetical protein [Candidatus Pacearchaeota archaeon]
MEKILKQSTYHIPHSRLVKLDITEYDKSKHVYVRINNPKNFENDKLTAIPRNDDLVVRVPKRIGDKMIRQTEIVLTSYQIVDKIEVKQEPKPVVKEEPKTNINPSQDPPEEKRTLLKTILSGKIKPQDFKSMAIEETQKRKDRLAKVTSEVDLSSALKPVGQNGKKILTGDDCDYSRGMALIEILKRLEDKNNLKDGLATQSQRKLLCEFYDVISFSGIGVVIGLYVALGSKSRGEGNLDFLSNWYKNELSKIYSPTSFGEIAKKGSQIANGLKPKQFRKRPNPGLSIKQAEKIISWLFTDKHTGEPLRARDLQCEIYQPIFFNDEQTRVYSIGATPVAKLVDIAINTGLDPLYFQSKKVEIGIPAGPARRSFDLPFAQHNNGLKITSIGCKMIYQEEEEGMEGMNPAQVAFINRTKSRRIEHLDTKKYMEDHPGTVSYFRIEAGRCNGVMANSIAIKDLDDCRKSTERSTAWSNSTKSLIEWS